MSNTLYTRLLALAPLLLALTSSQLLAAESREPEYSPPTFLDLNRHTKVAATEDQVNEMYSGFAERAKTPGLVYAVVLDGEILYSGGFGFTDLSNSIPVSNQSLFRVASMSKVITAQAILQLRDSGDLSLDDPVSLYVPEVGRLKPLTSDASEITIRHLLSHTAGFPEDNAWADRQLAMSDEDFIQLIEDGTPFSTVTEQGYEYSNVGYSLLGQIIQNVSGMSFETYTTQYILQPLNMNSTVWEYEKASSELLAKGYALKEDVYVEEQLENHGAFGPMAGLITSIEDFSKYAAFHSEAWPARNEPDDGPLKRSSLREMHQPHNVYTFAKGSCPYVLAYSYGLNWAEECNTPAYITHNGGLPGFGSNWLMAPEYGLAIMSFTNRTYMAPLFLNVNVLRHIIDEADLHSRAVQASSILEGRKEELLAILLGSTAIEDSNVFASNFFLDNNIDSYSNETKELLSLIGPILGYSELQPQNQLRGTFTLEGEDGEIEVFFSLTPEAEPLIQVLELELIE